MHQHFILQVGAWLSSWTQTFPIHMALLNFFLLLAKETWLQSCMNTYNVRSKHFGLMVFISKIIMKFNAQCTMDHGPTNRSQYDIRLWMNFLTNTLCDRFNKFMKIVEFIEVQITTSMKMKELSRIYRLWRQSKQAKL